MSASVMPTNIPQGLQAWQEIIRPIRGLQEIIPGQPTATQQQITTQEHIDLALRISSLESEIVRLKKFFTVHTATINILNSEKWELKRPPLYVSVEQREPTEFIACLYDIDIYGYGNTIPEAIDDLKEGIINQFEYLLEQESSIKLGNMPKRQLYSLKKIIGQHNV